jgi:multidrug efflux pump
LRSDKVSDLITWGPKMLDALRTIKIIADVNTDQQNRGLEVYVDYDRDTAARFGISPQLIDST